MINQTDKQPSEFSFFGFIFGLIFFGAGVFFLYYMAIKSIVDVVSSQSWQQIECTITKSELKTHHGSDGDTHKVLIEMRWKYGGYSYSGGSYNFSDVSSGGKKGKTTIINNYKVGEEYPCWVDPDNAERAVLNRDIPGIVWFIIPFSFLFIAVGGFIMLGAMNILPASWSGRFSHRHKPVPNIGVGFTELKPLHTPRGKVAFALFFASFWNGVTGVFVGIAVKSHLSGDPEWFLTFFIIPFVLIGIGAIVFVFHSILALFNPRASASISEGNPYLGQRVEFKWAFDKTPERIHNLTLTLKGEEQATYQQGTSTRTDKHVFYERKLMTQTHVSQIARGSVHIELPENTMHSFDSGNNKIVWSLVLHGEIEKWPDVNNDYVLVVRPKS